MAPGPRLAGDLGAAEFWASHAIPGANGSFHIDHVTGPDEENPDVNDEAYTNVAAKTTLQDAIQAAQVIGASVPANWSQIAAGLVVPVNAQATFTLNSPGTATSWSSRPM